MAFKINGTDIKSLKLGALDLKKLSLNGILIWWKNYFLRFLPNGGSGTMTDQTMAAGQSQKISRNLFTRVGYLFGGWGKNASGPKAYDDAQAVTDIAGPGETLSLYALWTAITYTVRFNGNGQTGGSMADMSFRYDERKALTKNAFWKTGYLFTSWQVSTADGKLVLSDGQTVGNLSSVNGAVALLTALWNAITYYVKYNGNGNTGGSMADTTCRYDQAANLRDNAFTRADYAFLGWATSANGAVVYQNKQSIKNLSSNHGGIVNLYAVWRGNPWYLTLNSVTWNYSTNNVGTASWNASAGEVMLQVKNEGTIAYAAAFLSASLPTRKCNRVKISVYVADTGGGGGSFTVNNKEVSGGQEYTFACTKDTFDLALSVQDPDEWGTVKLIINQIYFYNE